jgi:hypothetical protein
VQGQTGRSRESRAREVGVRVVVTAAVVHVRRVARPRSRRLERFAWARRSENKPKWRAETPLRATSSRTAGSAVGRIAVRPAAAW